MRQNTPPDRALLTRSAAAASIAVALLLVALKAWASWRTGSTAMLGSLADSTLDLVASGITLFAVWFASKPADHNHRFGHGKAEAVAAMVQVMLITVSAAGIALRAGEHLLGGQEVEAAGEGIAVSVIAILATFGLLAWQRYVIARTRSVAIRADFAHYQSDLLLNLAVIAALVLDTVLGLRGADPVFGLLIAAWLVRSAWRAGSEAIEHLMDAEWPEDKRRRLIEVVANHEGFSRLHDLRTRTAGDIDIAQFHIEMDPDLTVREAHDMLERVENDLAAAFPGLELFVHIDPRGQIDDPGNTLVEANEFEKLEKRP